MEYVNADGEDGQALYHSITDPLGGSSGSSGVSSSSSSSSFPTTTAPGVVTDSFSSLPFPITSSSSSSSPPRMIASPLPLSSSNGIHSLSPVAAFASLQYATTLNQGKDSKEWTSGTVSAITSPPTTHTILSNIRNDNTNTELSHLSQFNNPLASPQGALEMDGTVEPDIAESDEEEEEADNKDDKTKDYLHSAVTKYAQSIKSVDDKSLPTDKTPDFSSLPVRQREVARVLEALIQSPAAKAFILAQQPDLKAVLDNVIPQTLSSINSLSSSSSVSTGSTVSHSGMHKRSNSIVQLLSLSKDVPSSASSTVSPSITIPNYSDSASSLVMNMTIVPPPAPPSPSLSEVHSTVTNYSQDSVKATALLARLDNVISGALSSIDGKFNELRNGGSSSTVTSLSAPAPPESLGEGSTDENNGNMVNPSSSDTDTLEIPEPTIERLTKAALTPTRIPPYSGPNSPRRYESHILPSFHSSDNNNDDIDASPGTANTDMNENRPEENDEELPQELSAVPFPKSTNTSKTISGSNIRERTAKAREDARSRVWAQALGEIDTSAVAPMDIHTLDVISQEENKLLKNSSMAPLQRARMLKYAQKNNPTLVSPSTVRLRQLTAIADKLKKDTSSNDRHENEDYTSSLHPPVTDDNLELRSRAAQRRFEAWKARQSGSESSSVERNRSLSPMHKNNTDNETDKDTVAVVDAVRRIDLRATLMPSTQVILKQPKPERIVSPSVEKESLGNLISNLRIAIEEDSPANIEQSPRSVTQPSAVIHSPEKISRIPRAGQTNNNPLLMEDIGLNIPTNTAMFTSSFHSTENISSGPVIPTYTVSAMRMHPVLSLADAALAAADQMVLHQAEEYAQDVIPTLDIPLPPSFNNNKLNESGTNNNNKSYLSRSGIHTSVSKIPPPVLASVPLPPIDGNELTEEKNSKDTTVQLASNDNENTSSSERNDTLGVTTSISTTVLRTTDLENPVRLTIPYPAPPLQDPGTQTVPKERPQRSLRALSRLNSPPQNDNDGNHLKVSSTDNSTASLSSSIPALPFSPLTSSYASVNKSSFANAFSPSLPPTPSLPFTPSVHAYGALGVSGLSYGERTVNNTNMFLSSSLPPSSSSMAGRISSIIAPLGSSASLYAAISPTKAIVPSLSLYNKNAALSSTFTPRI